MAGIPSCPRPPAYVPPPLPAWPREIGIAMGLPALQTPSVPRQGQTVRDKYVVVYNFKDVGKQDDWAASWNPLI